MSAIINHDRTHMTGIPAGKGAAGKVVEVDAAPAAGTKTAAKFRLGTCVMDNGMTVTYSTSKDEVRYTWNEMFVNCDYIQHGVALKAGDTVLDVGANMGFFSIYCAEAVGAAGRVVAVEPAPDAQACFEANIASHREWLAGQRGKKAPAAPTLVRAAAGDGTCDTLNLTVYENSSAMNTTCPNQEAAEELLADTVYGLIREGKALGSFVERAGCEIAKAALRLPVTEPLVRFCVRQYAKRLAAARHEVAVPMVTVSDLIAQHKLERVSLLKVDVEGAELKVLQGIRDEDWAKIEQVTVEIHREIDGPLKEPILAMLRARGFANVVCVPYDEKTLPGIWLAYATRGQRA